MKWENILKNEYTISLNSVKGEIDNVKKLISEFNAEIVNTEEKFQNMLEDIKDITDNLDDDDVDDEAQKLLRTDIGRFFLDADFRKLVDLMELAYEERMEDLKVD